MWRGHRRFPGTGRAEPGKVRWPSRGAAPLLTREPDGQGRGARRLRRREGEEKKARSLEIGSAWPHHTGTEEDAELAAGTAGPALQAGCYVCKAHLEAGPGRRAARGTRDGAFADVFIAVEGAGPNAVTDPARALIGTGGERARSGAAPARRPGGKGGPLLGFEVLPSDRFQGKPPLPASQRPALESRGRARDLAPARLGRVLGTSGTFLVESRLGRDF